jgi:hypothetical protein
VQRAKRVQFRRRQRLLLQSPIAPERLIFPAGMLEIVDGSFAPKRTSQLSRMAHERTVRLIITPVVLASQAVNGPRRKAERLDPVIIHALR